MGCFSVIDLYELLLYFGINPLLVVSFAITFSHSEVCLFTLLIVSFPFAHKQKLMSLIRSYLFTFVFISITLGGGSQRILFRFMSLSVLPMFSSKSFREKAVATHSNTLAWKIPWTEEPGRLQSMGS